MPLTGVILIFNSVYYLVRVPFDQQIKVYSIIGVFTVILPIFFTLFLLFFKKIKSMTLIDGKDRLLPYIMAAIAYTMNYHLLTKLKFPEIITQYLLGTTLALVIALIINIRWKISIHMIGIGGIVALILILATKFQLDYKYIIGAIMLSGIIGTARLKLDSHLPLQIYSGFIMGFLSIFIVYIPILL